MIAQVNAAYTPALIVMDGVDPLWTAGLRHVSRSGPRWCWLSTDRVALDWIVIQLERLSRYASQLLDNLSPAW